MSNFFDMFLYEICRMDGGGDNGSDEEGIRHLLGVAHDMAVLGYLGNLYSEKYLNKP